MSETNGMTVAEFASAFLNIRNEMTDAAGIGMSAALKKKISVEDAVQEAYLTAAQRAETFSRGPLFKNQFLQYLNQMLAQLERKYCPEAMQPKKTVSVDIDIGGMKDESLIRVAKQDPYASLHKALEGMTEQDREILDLRHFKGLTNTACARALHISPKTAATRYEQALLHLKACIAPSSGLSL